MMMDVLEEHLSEAAFLWAQWERALIASNYTLAETTDLEERLRAHLDGLVTAGQSAIALLAPILQEGEEPGEVFAATWTLLVLAPHLIQEAVNTRTASAPPPVRLAITRALELGEDAAAEATLMPWLDTADPVMLSLALDVLGFRERVPHDKAVQLLGHSEEAVITAAVRALRPSQQRQAPRMLERLLGDSRPGVRWATIEACLLFGEKAAWGAVEEEATAAHGASRRLSWVLLATMDAERFLERLISFADDRSSREDALWALGFSGRMTAAEACLRWMKEEPRVARLAGEAFSAISGLKLEASYVLAEPEPEDALPPLEEDTLDADLSLRVEDSLPLPAPEQLTRWWATTRKDFTPATRYLAGRPFTGAMLLDALSHGPMRRRQVHAGELMLRTKGACTVQVRAFSRRQQQDLLRAAAVRERPPFWGNTR